mmetsp:Transcript_11223/g.33361  ORF Transcript_11223/g.33361 Transcript_11223/m.33361 type:complete len:461 (+) Transcript_11223:1111-2493(+)
MPDRLTAERACSSRLSPRAPAAADLRSPLLAVNNLSEALQALPGHTRRDDAGMRQPIDKLCKLSTLMEQIVSDMLDFERIDSGRMNMVPVTFSGGDLLTVARATFETAAESKGVHLRLVPPPSALACMRVRGDLTRLQQCLNNGVSNALKFTPKGGSVTVTMAEGSRQEDGRENLVITVKDTGIGLDREELDVLGRDDLFVQVGRGQLQGAGGTGLGLGITREILKAHGTSTMTLESAGPEQGTTFTLNLSLERAPQGDVAPQSGGTPPNSAPSKAAGKQEQEEVRWPGHLRCLHVEDDSSLRFSLPLSTFQLVGAPFDQAEDGLEAVEMVAKKPGDAYALIVMDNQMPRLDGTEATRRIRQAGYTGQIIGMTGDPMGSDDRDAFEQAGLTTCVDKNMEGVLHIRAVLRAIAEQHWQRADALKSGLDTLSDVEDIEEDHGILHAGAGRGMHTAAVDAAVD